MQLNCVNVCIFAEEHSTLFVGITLMDRIKLCGKKKKFWRKNEV